MKKYCLFLVFIILFLWCPSYAKKAYIKDIRTEIKQGSLFISFKLTDCFTDKMIQAIKNGVNTRFVFLIRLYKVKRLWRDKKIIDLKVVHSIHYDSIKKVYTLSFSEKSKKLITKDFNEAKKVMSQISKLKLVDIKKLEKGNRYQIRLKAELDKIKLPFHLHYVLFFLSLWNFDTDWYKVNLQLYE